MQFIQMKRKILPILLLLITIVVSCNPVHGAEAWTMTEYSMCKDVSGDTREPLGNTMVFMTNDPWAVLWINFSNIYKGLKMKVEWYYPDGSMYADKAWSLKHPGEGKHWTKWRTWTSIKIDGERPAENLGEWTVKVYVDGVHEFTTSFEIASWEDTIKELDDLRSGLDKLEKEHGDLKAEHGALKSEYDTLRSDYDDLDADYGDIKAKHDAMGTKYSTLRSEYDTLESEHDTLESDYNSALDELGTSRNLMYVFIVTTIIFIVTTVKFVIAPRTAK